MVAITANDLAVAKAEILLEEKRFKTEILREVTRVTSYKKGEVTKEIFKFPMPSGERILKNRNIDIVTYGQIILKSNFGGYFVNSHDRYIYENKLTENIEELALLVGVTPRTLKSHIAKLKRCNVTIMKTAMVQGNLVYLLTYANDNNHYVSITNVALRKLCNAYSENTLRIYLILSYMCIDVEHDPKTEETVIREREVLITQKTLCEKIGISPKSRKLITDCVGALINGGFIKVRTEYIQNPNLEDDGEVFDKIPNKYYSLSDEYLKI